MPNTPGVYTYYLSVASPGGSVCSDTTRVTVIGAPRLGDSTRLACGGSTVDLTSVYNLTGLQTNWTLNGNPVFNPAAVAIGGNYQLIANNATGCADTAFVRLTLDTVRTRSVVVQPGCTGLGSIQAVTESGIAPFTYNISTQPGIFGTTNTWNNLPAGNYVITTRDSLGCIGRENISLTYASNLTLETLGDMLICGNSSIVLQTTSNATSFQWSPADGLSSTTAQSPTATPTQPVTTYTVVATLGNCTDTSSFTVTVDPGVQVNAGPDITIIVGETARLMEQ